MTEAHMLDIGSERDKFDIPDGVAYFNTAYNAPLLNASRAALLDAAGDKSHPFLIVSHRKFAEKRCAMHTVLFGIGYCLALYFDSPGH